MSQIKFLCKACGKEHIGLPHIGFAAPAHYDEATEEERRKHFTLTPDTCIMKDADGVHYFVRAALLIPILGTQEMFGWGIWVTLSEKNFRRYQTLTDADVLEEPTYFGWFCSNLPGYPRTNGLKTEVKLQTNNQRPLVTLEPTEHPLAVEQREGISIERALELAGPYLHR